ncbi:MAG TPA: LPS assembly lipoprotein LptE [Moraxellaceae bacterium]|nr:LPS assembly lipoprotein LptE [Moraxellaceae bacterium]
MTPTRTAARMRRLALVLPMMLALAACGFQLRGSYNVPTFLTAVSLKVPASTRTGLGTELRLALERKKISADGGDIQLEVVNERINRQASSVDNLARAAEYILVYTVDFRVNSTDGHSIGPVDTLILRRSYQYSPENVVGKNIEEETLIRELRADAAQQIVRQLCSMKEPPPPKPDPASDVAAPGTTPGAAPAAATGKPTP